MAAVVSAAVVVSLAFVVSFAFVLSLAFEVLCSLLLVLSPVFEAAAYVGEPSALSVLIGTEDSSDEAAELVSPSLTELPEEFLFIIVGLPL